MRGRPLEYNETFPENAANYLQKCDSELKELPSIEGLAVFLGIARSTIYEWKDKYTDFSDIVEKILAEQSKKLINNGLSGKYNASITKLILTKHGYSDKQEITGADGKDLIPQPILGNFNVHTHPSDAEDSEAEQTD